MSAADSGPPTWPAPAWWALRSTRQRMRPATSLSSSTVAPRAGGQRLGQVALVRVHALDGEALRGVLPVIVDLLQVDFQRRTVFVVLVGRVAGPVAGRRE